MDDPSNKFREIEGRNSLFLAFANIFDHLQKIMFHRRAPLDTESAFKEKISSLDERFELVVEIVTSAKGGQFKKGVESCRK